MVAAATVSGLREVKQRIEQACRENGRDPASVTLIAVSKTFAADAIVPVIDAGQRVFGENRVQEAKAKWPPLEGAASAPRLAFDRNPAIEQGQGGGRALRRHPFGRPAKPVRGARQGDRQAKTPADPVRRGQYRWRAAKVGRTPGRYRRVPARLSRNLWVADRGPHVHSAPRRGPGAALRSDGQDRAPKWVRTSAGWA